MCQGTCFSQIEVSFNQLKMLSLREYIQDYGENRNSTNLYGNQTRWQF